MQRKAPFKPDPAIGYSQNRGPPFYTPKILIAEARQKGPLISANPVNPFMLLYLSGCIYSSYELFLMGVRIWEPYSLFFDPKGIMEKNMETTIICLGYIGLIWGEWRKKMETTKNMNFQLSSSLEP